MKIRLLIVLMLGAIKLHAQKFDSKFDSLSYSSDSALVIIYQGEKNAVYEVSSKRMLLKPTKNRRVLFMESTTIAEFDQKKNSRTMYSYKEFEYATTTTYEDTCNLLIADLRFPDAKPIDYTILRISEDRFILSAKNNAGFYSGDSSTYSYYTSGVYNVRTNTWELPQFYGKLIPGPLGYLAAYQEYESLTNDLILVDYIIFNSEFGIVTSYFKDAELGDISLPAEFIRYAITDYKVDSVFAVSSGFAAHQLEPSLNPLYYFSVDRKLGLYEGDHELKNALSNDLYEFVHYNRNLEVLIYLEGDSIKLISPFGAASAPRKNGKLIYKQHDVMRDPVYSFQILSINGTDTTSQGTLDPSFASLTTISLEVRDSLLVVEDHTSMADFSKYSVETNTGTYNYVHRFETENSSIWKLTSSGWQKISPSYATIQLLDNGWAIASTGTYENFTERSDGMPLNEDRIFVVLPKSYLILNASMQAIPYMDYFDFAEIVDLGFGLKVKFNEGEKYFFMTYELEAITNSEWDDFVIENGQLKAILRQTFKLDSNGEIIFDEDGNPVVENPEKTELFSLN